MPRTSLSRAAIVRFGPVIIVLSVLQARNLIEDLERYWVMGTVYAASAVALTAPAGAALAAWEASRLRRGGVHDWAPVRSPLRIALAALTPILGGLTFVFVATLIAIWPSMIGVPGGPDLRLLSVVLTVTGAFVLLGYGVGRALPPLVAIPGLLAVILI